MRFLITGTAGFVGFHLARRLLADGHQVTGFDGMTPYYDVQLKRDRHGVLEANEGFHAHVAMLEDMDALTRAAEQAQPDVIVHLAAQAGVRYSLENPRAYVDSNLVGSFNVLEIARLVRPAHLLLASTSSVYGANTQMPFSETDPTDHPMTLYAATKKAMEAMSHSYAHLWNLPTTCFRFFTVYGPWGRPDMALFKFVAQIEAGQPIPVFGNGQMQRDFTYIDDLVEAVARLVDIVPIKGEPVQGEDVTDTLSPAAPWRAVNLGGGAPAGLMQLITSTEAALGRTAIKDMLPMQPGDVPVTHADYRLLEALTGYRPRTSLEEGIARFVEWYRDYRKNG
jgi:UDP-glucuronate 4-epimerase